MLRKTTAVISLLALLVVSVGVSLAGTPLVHPKNMPISKFWRRSFASQDARPPQARTLSALQTAVPRAMAVPLPKGGPASTKVDINHCSLEDLQRLPGVGAAMGGHIMAGRPYRDFDDLSRDGVPLNFVDQIRSLVRFGE
jgi:hypothetical protein